MKKVGDTGNKSRSEKSKKNLGRNANNIKGSKRKCGEFLA
jgi:hypothetical protein